MAHKFSKNNFREAGEALLLFKADIRNGFFPHFEW